MWSYLLRSLNDASKMQWCSGNALNLSELSLDFLNKLLTNSNNCKKKKQNVHHMRSFRGFLGRVLSMKVYDKRYIIKAERISRKYI